MIPAPDLPDEAARLAELAALRGAYRPGEARFDRIVRVACQALGTPMGLITMLTEDRNWFLASQGIEGRSAERRASFCGHVIAGDEPMIIPDARADQRFHDNPHVLGWPKVRHYAGRAIRGPTGKRVGVICVIDDEPREMGAAERRTLDDLGHWVETEIRLAALSDAQQDLLRRFDQLERQALVDPLTGAWNRRGLKDVLERESADDSSPLSVLAIDVDRFKTINDQHGHAIGDSVLREIAIRARGALRATDAFGRWGGDEFVAVLADCPAVAAQELADRLRLAIAGEPVRRGSRSVPVSVSIGVASVPRGRVRDVSELIAAADLAMYAAKQAGRDQVRCAA